MTGRRCAAWLPILLVVLTGCVASHDAPVLSHSVVHASDLDITIPVDGSLRSSTPALITAKSSGKILWIIPEGTTVHKGDKVLEIENKDLETEYALAHDDLIAAQHAVDNAERELKLKQLEAQKQINDTDTALSAARLAADEYLKGKSPLAELDLKLAVDKATTELTDAQEKFGHMPLLLAKGFVTVSEKRTAELDVREKTEALEHKRRELEIFRLYDNPTQVAKVQSDVLTAKLARDRIADQMATELAGKQADIDKSHAEYAKLKQKVDQLADQLKNLRLFAPNEGLVIYGIEGQTIYWGGNNADPYAVGSQVNENQVMMSIPDVRSLEATVTVSEIDLGRVSKGLTAITQVQGVSGRKFTGQIKKIASTAQQNWLSDVKNYEVTVTLGDTTGLSFHSGVTVHTEIQISHLKHVLHVPVEMVFSHGTEHGCYVRQPDHGFLWRPVELGAATDTQVVITKGLSEGDDVVLPEEEPDAAPGVRAAGGGDHG